MGKHVDVVNLTTNSRLCSHHMNKKRSALMATRVILFILPGKL